MLSSPDISELLTSVGAFGNRIVSMNKHFGKPCCCDLLREKLDAADFTILSLSPEFENKLKVS